MYKVIESMQKVSEGNFDQNVFYTPRSKRDEIGLLTNTFNKMASQLKDLYANLNQKVKEQVKQLQEELDARKAA